MICNTKGDILVETKNTFSLEFEIATAKNMIKQIYKDNNTNDDKFVFEKIYFNTIKIFYLANNDNVICGIFNQNTKSYLVKIFLIHVLIAYLNFNSEFINLNKTESKTPDLYTIRDVSSIMNVLTVKEKLNLKLFEV
jgi:hypothetical protein